MVVQVYNKPTMKTQKLNLIIPMAGKGKRMLPHTLTTPKPLIAIAGKPIVKRILEEIGSLYPGPIGHIGFVVNGLLPDVQADLQAMATTLGAQSHFYEQKEALGTAHAIGCAAPLLQGPVMVAFADTLFKGNSPVDIDQEGVILVNRVPNPADFGVVRLGPDQFITAFIEKPTQFVSDLAIIGIYYFKEGSVLQEAIQHIIDRNICNEGEYQLTSALSYMQQKGFKFGIHQVDEWFDCGNKQATLHTNQRFLEWLQDKEAMISPLAQVQHSKIIPPVCIGEGVLIEHSIIGPYVSVGRHTHIVGSRIKNSIIQEHTAIQHGNIENSMIGSHVHIQGKSTEINVGDYNIVML
jgi:glucose-1-phosphate thymidylyltransferase